MKLGELIRPAKILRAGGTGYPLLSMTMRNGLVPQGEKFKKRVAGADLSQYKVVQNGQLVVGFPIDEAVLAFQRSMRAGIVSPAYAVWDVIDKAVVDSLYLERFLRSPIAIAYYLAKLQGSTARRRSLPNPVFLDMDVPLPALDEQRRIAAILDKAGELRTKRRQALAHLDTLTHSIFHSMFEQMEFPTAPMGSVATFFGGNSLPEGQAFANQSLGYLLLKVSDMNRSGNERLFLTAGSWSEAPGSKASTCPPGCVVLPKRGASISTNKKRLTVRHSVLDPNLMAVKPSPALDSAYLFAWFESFDLTTITSGSSVPQLNKQDLHPLPIPIPPLELQHLFATRIAAAERLKEIHRKHLAELDGLFASLQYRAFKGEL
ncbi:restriction endonuclease subunit S [Arthrobacter sp. Z1-9]